MTGALDGILVVTLEQAVAAAGPGDGGGGARVALGRGPAALEVAAEGGLALGGDRLCGEDVQLSHGPAPCLVTPGWGA